MRCPKCHKEKSAFIIKIFGSCWQCNLSTNIERKRIEKSRDLSAWLKEHKKDGKKQ
jgi:hypothetical protein